MIILAEAIINFCYIFFPARLFYTVRLLISFAFNFIPLQDHFSMHYYSIPNSANRKQTFQEAVVIFS